MKIKICGLVSQEEINALDALRIDFGGIWSGVPRGRYNLDQDTARSLLSLETQFMELVLVTLEGSFEKIDAILAGTRARAVQLHGFQMPALIRKLKRAYADAVKVVKVFHVQNATCLEEDIIDRYIEAGTDLLLFDSYGSKEQIGSSGSRIQNDYLRKIYEHYDMQKVIIAGGIHEANIAALAAFANPFGVDIDTSARTGERLDYNRIARLTNAINTHGTAAERMTSVSQSRAVPSPGSWRRGIH